VSIWSIKDHMAQMSSHLIFSFIPIFGTFRPTRRRYAALGQAQRNICSKQFMTYLVHIRFATYDIDGRYDGYLASTVGSGDSQNPTVIILVRLAKNPAHPCTPRDSVRQLCKRSVIVHHDSTTYIALMTAVPNVGRESPTSNLS